MLRGYRFIVLALGLILVGAGEPHKGGTQGKQGQAHSNQQDASTPANIGLPSSQPQDHGCKRGQDNRQSDLCAQWKAADAAAESARWTFWTFITGLAGLLAPITADYMARLENRTARIWAIGEIRYQDIFGVDRVTAYRGYYDFMRGFVWDREGNDST